MIVRSVYSIGDCMFIGDEIANYSLPGDHSEQAAFYAYLSHDVANIGSNQILVFDKVITNIGNLYNGITGVFTCDFSGTYVVQLLFDAMLLDPIIAADEAGHKTPQQKYVHT